MFFGFYCRMVIPWLVAGLGLQGCSLLYAPNGQCERDSDCVKLGRLAPELAGSYCLEHVCTFPKAETRECETHSDCVEANSGTPSVCRNFSCVSLLNGECTQVLNAGALAKNDDVILLGAFAPLSSSFPAGDTILMSYQLALDDLTSNAKGAAAVSGSQKRPFVVVACRSDGAKDLSDSFDHLAKNLRVPVIVTNQSSTDLETQVTRLMGDPGINTMFLSPVSSDPTLAALSDKGRLWHMLGSPTDLAPAYLRLIAEQIGKATTKETRLVLVVNDVRAMGQIADAVERNLKINGVAVADAMAAGTYRRVSVESALANPTSPNVSKMQTAILEVKPNVIVMLAGPEVVDLGIVATEQSWQDFGIAEPPRYVLSHHLFNSESLRLAISSLPGFDSRAYGVNFAGATDRSLYQGYLTRLAASYPSAFVPEYENYYDAAMFAMLGVVGASFATPTDQISGDLAVKGFRRLIDPSGATFALWPEMLATMANSILGAGSTGTIYLTGTLGSPEFSADGARISTATLWCFEVASGTPQYTSGNIVFERARGAFSAAIDDCQLGAP